MEATDNINESQKYSAVVMAGGSKRFSFRELWHQIEDLFIYREWYFKRGYKCLKRITLKEERKNQRRSVGGLVNHLIKK